MVARFGLHASFTVSLYVWTMIHITDAGMQASFYILLILFLLISLVLVYRWHKRGARREEVAVAETVYFIVSAVLLVVAGLGAFLF
jgi:hypothetical protein